MCTMHHHVLHKWKYATKQIHKSRLNFSTWSTLCKSNDFQDQFEQRREAIANGPGLEDFISGDSVNDEWKNYTGELVRKQGMKR